MRRSEVVATSANALMVECPSRPHRSLSHQGRSAIRGGPIYFCAPLRTPQQLALPLQRRGRVQSGTSRMWTPALGSMSTPAHGYEATRGAAMAAFVNVMAV